MDKKDFASVKARFLRYVKVDTQSQEESDSFPSTQKQKDLARILFAELRDLGLEAYMDEDYGYVYGWIPSTLEEEERTLAFIAHMDTSPAVSGKGVNPQVVENYQGQVLELGGGRVLDPKVFPSLENFIGQDLITTDGTTLLGADDKAGVAEIMTMAAYLVAHPEVKHGPLALCFTPDEEVGAGVDHIDLDRLGADFAYTVDGGLLGEIEYENFNAASGQVTIKGRSVHPGSAKGLMVNALDLAVEFAASLPQDQVPQKTEGYEGFFHLDRLEGDVSGARLSYIIRDHDRDLFEKKKALFRDLGKKIQDKYGEDALDLKLEDSYYNMKEKIEPHMFLIDRAKEAMEAMGIEPRVKAIRGGTDGARLSYMGLPTPNLCAGGLNFHGEYEYVSVQSMEAISQLLVQLAMTVFK
ncbi:MAG: peptidase T [Tissierellia bacterium]|nr:peptidase T [Tissierellia bacterium]